MNHIVSNGSLSGACTALFHGSVSVNAMLNLDQANSQALASFYTTLALQDLLSGNTTWKSTVTSNVQTWISKNDIYSNGTAGSTRMNTNGMCVSFSIICRHF